MISVMGKKLILSHLQGQSLYYHNRSAASKSNNGFTSLHFAATG